MEQLALEDENGDLNTSKVRRIIVSPPFPLPSPSHPQSHDCLFHPFHTPILKYSLGGKDVKFRRTAECSKPHVTWNTRHRCWLPPDASSFLLQELSKCPLWPVEVARLSSTAVTKGKTKEEEVAMSYHGVTYVNLAPLLYPGGRRTKG